MSKKIVYSCKDNDVELIVYYKDNKPDEIHVGIEGMDEWTVVGFDDLLKAIPGLKYG